MSDHGPERPHGDFAGRSAIWRKGGAVLAAPGTAFDPFARPLEAHQVGEAAIPMRSADLSSTGEASM
jgi:hypothetical protein